MGFSIEDAAVPIVTRRMSLCLHEALHNWARWQLWSCWAPRLSRTRGHAPALLSGPVGHPDSAGWEDVLLLCCLTASSTLPCLAWLHPSPALPLSPPLSLALFCPGLLAQPCSASPLLPVHVHTIPTWFQPRTDRAGFNPVNQQPDSPSTNIFPRSSKHQHQILAINLVLLSNHVRSCYEILLQVHKMVIFNIYLWCSTFPFIWEWKSSKVFLTRPSRVSSHILVFACYPLMPFFFVSQLPQWV